MLINGKEPNDWALPKEPWVMGYNDWGSAIKKTLQHPKANEQARSDFQNKIDAYKSEGRTIVYLDESGFARDRPSQHVIPPFPEALVRRK